MHGPSLTHRIRVESHAIWLAARDPRTPVAARLIGLFIAAYALSPIDLVPDFIPVIGLLDEAVLIPAGMWVMTRMIPPALMAEHRAAAERAARRPVGWGGIAIVLAVWGLLIWLAYGWIAVAWD